jgi:hypothetical protein
MSQSTPRPRRRVSLGFIFTLFLIAAVIVLELPKPNHGGPSRKSTCINNLRTIDGAIQEWALENNKTNFDIVTWADLRPLLSRSGTELPHCPSGGTYFIKTVSEKPTCSYPGHVLR